MLGRQTTSVKSSTSKVIGAKFTGTFISASRSKVDMVWNSFRGGGGMDTPPVLLAETTRTRNEFQTMSTSDFEALLKV